MTNKSLKIINPVIDQSKFPKKEKLGFVENRILPIGIVLMIGLFGYAAIKEALDPKKDIAVLSLSSMYAFIGVAGLFMHKYKKDSFESRFIQSTQESIIKSSVSRFEREYGNGTYPSDHSSIPDPNNPLYEYAKEEFWLKFENASLLPLLLDGSHDSGLRLGLIPPIEFMTIIRPIFTDNLKVRGGNVKFYPHNGGYGPGRFRLKVTNIPIITDLTTGQTEHRSCINGFELPQKEGVYCNGKVHLSGLMKKRFMEKYLEITASIEEPIKEYLKSKKELQNTEWDILITYRPKPINANKEIPSWEEWRLERVEMDVVIDLVQKIPIDEIKKIEQFYSQKKLEDFDD